MGARSGFVQKLLSLSANKSLRTYTPIHAGTNHYLPRNFKDLFKYDLSEITGLDDLNNPNGLILEAQQKAAELFQVDRTVFSVNGASGCLTAACLALGEGGKVLVPRNAHKSIIAGLILSGAEPVWYEPSWDETWGVYREINPNLIYDALRINRDIKGCFVTAETYEGLRPNLAQIVEICHEHDIPVIADESHGGHLSLLKQGAGAVNACADVIVHSAHKSLGALTQTGLLHIQSDLISPQKLGACLSLLQSSSPSQLLLASLIETIESLSQSLSPLRKQIYVAEELQAALSKIKHIKVLNNDDPTRCVVQIGGWNGEELSQWLFDNYKIETELQSENWIMLLLGIGIKWHQTKHLRKALEKAAKLAETREKKAISKIAKPLPFNQTQNARKAFLAKNTATLSFSCPPGIPTEIPGSILDSTHVMSIASLINHAKQAPSPYLEDEDLEPEVEELNEEESNNFARLSQFT
jgi:arginine decarboxylase